MTYSSVIVARAREHADAGWNPWKIRQFLQQELGVLPSVETIKTWVDPEYAKARSNRHAKRLRESYVPRGRRTVSDELKLARMRELRSAGLSHDAIGVVAGVWWGERLSRSQVTRRLGEEPRRRGRRAGMAVPA